MGWSKLPWTHQNAAANVKLHEKRLAEPLRWKTPRRVFVNSMSDLFHELVPNDFIDLVFIMMAKAPQHVFQILTKRPQRMRDWFASGATGATWGPWPLPNVWLGVSAEDQRRWDERVEILGRVPAAVRFVSVEPMLGPIDVGNAFDPSVDGSDYQPIDWVILGGETGRDYRPMNPEWAENLAAQCVGIPLFVKQDSGPRPGKQGRLSDALWARKEYPSGAAPSPDPRIKQEAK